MSDKRSAQSYARDAYLSVFVQDRGVFLAQTGWWCVLCFLVGFTLVMMFRSVTIEGLTYKEPSILVGAIFAAALEIAWGRYMLLGEIRSGFEIFRFRKRHLRFAAYSFLLALPNYIVDRLVTHYITPTPYQDPYGIAIKVVTELIGIYFTWRLGLGFALISVDAPAPLRTGWKLSRDDHRLLLGVAMLVFIPMTIVEKTIYLWSKFFEVAWTAQFALAFTLIFWIATSVCIGTSFFTAYLRDRLGPTEWGRIRSESRSN